MCPESVVFRLNVEFRGSCYQDVISRGASGKSVQHEHHFLLVACHHLVKSIDKFDIDISKDPLVASELKAEEE